MDKARIIDVRVKVYGLDHIVVEPRDRKECAGQCMVGQTENDVMSCTWKQCGGLFATLTHVTNNVVICYLEKPINERVESHQMPTHLRDVDEEDLRTVFAVSTTNCGNVIVEPVGACPHNREIPYCISSDLTHDELNTCPHFHRAFNGYDDMTDEVLIDRVHCEK